MPAWGLAQAGYCRPLGGGWQAGDLEIGVRLGRGCSRAGEE